MRNPSPRRHAAATLWPLLVGGALILAAKVLLILRLDPPPHGDPAPMT